jgi:glutamyl-tRNA synthetase
MLSARRSPRTSPPTRCVPTEATHRYTGSVPEQSKYRGRIAPSPTGLLHIGHARTFWIAFQRALASHGALIFRNEDLDAQRSRPEFVEAMFTDLRWLGIRWQEGPDVGGPCAPYEQSRRRVHYLNAWRSLLQRGYLYPCRCSRKDLARMAQAPHEGPDDPDDEPVYPGTCRPVDQAAYAFAIAGELRLHPDLIPANADLPSVETRRQQPPSWRFRVPDGEVIEFDDANLGPQRYTASRDFGDFLVWRRDDVPSYQLAVVADDAAMRITEVVRGADLLKSTARQILLYRALGLDPPLWYHCSLVKDDHGQRLAKRHDALSLRALRESGAPPEQVLARFDRS